MVRSAPAVPASRSPPAGSAAWCGGPGTDGRHRRRATSGARLAGSRGTARAEVHPGRSRRRGLGERARPRPRSLCQEVPPTSPATRARAGCAARTAPPGGGAGPPSRRLSADAPAARPRLGPIQPRVAAVVSWPAMTRATAWSSTQASSAPASRSPASRLSGATGAAPKTSRRARWTATRGGQGASRTWSEGEVWARTSRATAASPASGPPTSHRTMTSRASLASTGRSGIVSPVDHPSTTASTRVLTSGRGARITAPISRLASL